MPSEAVHDQGDRGAHRKRKAFTERKLAELFVGSITKAGL